MCLFYTATLSFAKPPIQLAIVLDDLGNSKHDLQALKLPTQITFAVLPYTPFAKKLAKQAHSQNRELLLHMPMQAKIHNEKLGKGALMLNMQELVFKEELSKALHYFPGATAMNNHMGSTLTEHIEPMQWTMEVLNKQGLYFLDSRTSAQTIAQSTAQISGVPALRRHIFLDNIKTNKAMTEQLQQALEIGKNNLPVVIIAHPYPETIQFLRDNFTQQNQQFDLVPLHQLLSQSERLAIAKKRNEWQQAQNIIINHTKQTQ
ncbi:divergent polysaccharide deacetylase family protein [Psychromonas sp. KJ10-10]|uniref:divergent polysaccharide deacetylase family protein n=1 Tax=Psychromonas sp. KJ10-10 TaxID=3391823 RepID=UPI0039B4D90E